MTVAGMRGSFTQKKAYVWLMVDQNIPLLIADTKLDRSLEHRAYRKTSLYIVAYMGPLAAHFFFLASSLASPFATRVTILPSITTPLPSMKATRESPSQFLKVSHTSGCWGAKDACAISLDFRAWGSSIFFPPVSLPIFHFSLVIRQAARPHRTKPIGLYPTLISPGMSSTWICASNSAVCVKVVSFL